MNYNISILKAAHMYLSRKAGFIHPEGNKDGGGRFYPKGRDAEVMADVRAPSRSFPWSYYKACLTLKHCAAYYDVVDMKALRKATKLGVLELSKMIDEAEGKPVAVIAPMDIFEPVDASWFTTSIQQPHQAWYL